jgi:hypothetical protein
MLPGSEQPFLQDEGKPIPARELMEGCFADLGRRDDWSLGHTGSLDKYIGHGTNDPMTDFGISLSEI